MLIRFLRGAAYLGRGASFLATHRDLWSLVVAPFVLTGIAFALGVWALVANLGVILDWIAGLFLGPFSGPSSGPSSGSSGGGGDGGLGARLRDGGPLAVVFYVLAILALVPVALFSFFPVAALIASPFTESLSERVEEKLTGRAPAPPRGWLFAGRLARDLLLTIAHEGRKILRYLAILVLLIPLLFIPLVGPPLHLALSFFVTARFAAYDALDATMARHGWSFARKQAFLRRHRGLTTGLGCAMAAVAIVPGLNLLLMPVAAIAGTRLFIDAGGDSTA